MTLNFNFGGVRSTVQILEKLPARHEILDIPVEDFDKRCLLVCDKNTLRFANKIRENGALPCVSGAGEKAKNSKIRENAAPLCILDAGEKAKNSKNIGAILLAAKNAGLGRDSIFIAVGGGVISDIAGFAASIYMRGTGLVIVSTTLLGMVDAAVGGKTGIDIFRRKNLAGTFYPASRVYLPIETLRSLPASQIKSGLAEIIKTAVLDKDGDDGASFEKFYSLRAYLKDGRAENSNEADETFMALIAKSVEIKGRIVEADPRETGSERALLNLGHTFAHALESSAGLGKLSHGEAVAWGIARACALGVFLQITPVPRAEKICRLLQDFGYETRAPHPAMKSIDIFMRALEDDKKKKAGLLRFVVPAVRGAELVQIEGGNVDTVKKIVLGAWDSGTINRA
jgi:3-dehydroquinate synthase